MKALNVASPAGHPTCRLAFRLRARDALRRARRPAGFGEARQSHDGIIGRAADRARRVIALELREMDRRVPIGEQSADQPPLIAHHPAALRIPADDEAALSLGRVEWARVGFLHCLSHWS